MEDPLDRVRHSTQRVLEHPRCCHVNLGPETAYTRAAESFCQATGVLHTESHATTATMTTTMTGDSTGNHCFQGAELETTEKWDEDRMHFTDDTETSGALTCQYTFVLDALNFCFWPSTTGLEYENLATSLTSVLRNDPKAFDADRLCAVTEETLSEWFAPHDLPNLPERVRKVREVSELFLSVITNSYGITFFVFMGTAWKCSKKQI